MILDMHADPHTTRRHRVVDVLTGEELRGLRIWYADDEVGVIRCYAQSMSGRPVVNRKGTAFLWGERLRDIRVVPKTLVEIAAIEESERETAENVAVLRDLAATSKVVWESAKAEILRN